jgi:LEA14-like dessication related protein
MRCQTSFLILLALSLPIGGCATMEAFTPPDVTLVDIRFEDLTVFETSGTFTVRLSNENPEPMVVDGAVYRLYLGGQRVGKALSDERLEVPRLGSSTYEVDVYLNNVALAARLLTLGQETGLDYTIKGKLYVERPYGTRRLRFSRDGRIDFSAAGTTSRTGDLSEVAPTAGAAADSAGTTAS